MYGRSKSDIIFRMSKKFPVGMMLRLDKGLAECLQRCADDHHVSREELVRTFIAMGLSDLWFLPKDYYRPVGNRSPRSRQAACAPPASAPPATPDASPARPATPAAT